MKKRRLQRKVQDNECMIEYLNIRVLIDGRAVGDEGLGHVDPRKRIHSAWHTAHTAVQSQLNHRNGDF